MTLILCPFCEGSRMVFYDPDWIKVCEICGGTGRNMDNLGPSDSFIYEFGVALGRRLRERLGFLPGKSGWQNVDSFSFIFDADEVKRAWGILGAAFNLVELCVDWTYRSKRWHEARVFFGAERPSDWLNKQKFVSKSIYVCDLEDIDRVLDSFWAFMRANLDVVWNNR